MWVMSRAFSTNPAKLSLVDRLADPDRSVGENELSGSNGRPTSIFLKNLARDLSDLLNTRCSLQRYAERDPHAIATLFDFGLPEHTGVFSVSPDEFGQILKRCISSCGCQCAGAVRFSVWRSGSELSDHGPRHLHGHTGWPERGR
jgi:hypothetical protein